MCGRLSWLYVSFWAHKNTVYCIIPYLFIYYEYHTKYSQSKGKICTSCARSVSRTWQIKQKDEVNLDKTEMSMIRWTRGLTLTERQKNAKLRELLEPVNLVIRLRWFGHTEGTPEEDLVGWLIELRFTSHLTQNRSFWRCSSQPVSWLVLRKQKSKTTKNNKNVQ